MATVATTVISRRNDGSDNGEDLQRRNEAAQKIQRAIKRAIARRQLPVLVSSAHVDTLIDVLTRRKRFGRGLVDFITFVVFYLCCVGIIIDNCGELAALCDSLSGLPLNSVLLSLSVHMLTVPLLTLSTSYSMSRHSDTECHEQRCQTCARKHLVSDTSRNAAELFRCRILGRPVAMDICFQ